MSTPNSQELDHGQIKFRRDHNVAWITLSRPQALNSLTWEMYQQLEEILIQMEGDTSVRVVVLRGDGDKALAAGTDIQQFQGFTADAGVEYEQRIDGIISRLANLPVPTLAAVHGYAVGGGLMLATACDLCYSTDDAKFGAPMARTLGNCLSYANYHRLAEVIGVKRVKELLYTSRLLSASEAQGLGLVTQIFPKDKFFEQVQETALRIASHAPLTIWATKQAFMKKSLPQSQDPCDKEHSTGQEDKNAESFEQVIRRVYGSLDFAEGVSAHVDKRRPVWRGK